MPDGINIALREFPQLLDRLSDLNTDAEKVVKRTISDARSRAPAWISAGVTEVYGIKKADVKAALAGTEGKGKGKVSGIEVDVIGFVYKGNPLTPAHFKMKPARPPAKRQKNKMPVPGQAVAGGSDVAMMAPPAPYTITAEIFKGKRVSFGKGVFLGGNKGGGFIPFQRSGEGRLPIESIKTVSVPQMIDNEKVSAIISKNIDDGLKARLENHLRQAVNKRQG